MRDLTAEELALAPEWATHYIVDSGDNSIIYESKNLCWWAGLGKPLACKRMDEGAIAIIRKPFDITQHEFSDEFTYFDFELHKDRGGIIIDGEVNRGDIIAIAKHFKLTAEDLK